MNPIDYQSQIKRNILSQFSQIPEQQETVIQEDVLIKAINEEGYEVYTQDAINKFTSDIQKAAALGRITQDDIEKAKKDLSKLVKVTKMDKNGKKVTVWVKRGEEPKEDRKGKTELSNYKSHTKDDKAEIEATIKRQKSLLANPKSPASAKKRAQEILKIEEAKLSKLGGGSQPKADQPKAETKKTPEKQKEAPERSGDHEALIAKKKELAEKVKKTLANEKDPDRRAELTTHASRLEAEHKQLSGESDSAVKYKWKKNEDGDLTTEAGESIFTMKNGELFMESDGEVSRYNGDVNNEKEANDVIGKLLDGDENIEFESMESDDEDIESEVPLEYLVEKVKSGEYEPGEAIHKLSGDEYADDYDEKRDQAIETLSKELARPAGERTKSGFKSAGKMFWDEDGEMFHDIVKVGDKEIVAADDGEGGFIFMDGPYSSKGKEYTRAELKKMEGGDKKQANKSGNKKASAKIETDRARMNRHDREFYKLDDESRNHPRVKELSEKMRQLDENAPIEARRWITNESGKIVDNPKYKEEAHMQQYRKLNELRDQYEKLRNELFGDKFDALKKKHDEEDAAAESKKMEGGNKKQEKKDSTSKEIKGEDSKKIMPRSLEFNGYEFNQESDEYNGEVMYEVRVGSRDLDNSSEISDNAREAIGKFREKMKADGFKVDYYGRDKGWVSMRVTRLDNNKIKKALDTLIIGSK